MFEIEGPAVMLAGSDLPRLERALDHALRFGWLVRGATPPRVLLDLADAVLRASEAQRSWAAGVAALPLASVPIEVPHGEQGWMTTAEAAKLAGLAEGTIRKHANRGTIAARRAADGSWRIDRGGLVAWLAEREAAAREAVRL